MFISSSSFNSIIFHVLLKSFLNNCISFFEILFVLVYQIIHFHINDGVFGIVLIILSDKDFSLIFLILIPAMTEIIIVFSLKLFRFISLNWLGFIAKIIKSASLFNHIFTLYFSLSKFSFSAVLVFMYILHFVLLFIIEFRIISHIFQHQMNCIIIIF